MIKTMKIVRWPIDPNLAKETDEHYRTRFALTLKDKDPMEIVRAITFDNVAPHITLDDAERFVDFADSKLLGGALRGVGLEVGAGCGFFSSIFAKREAVRKMYAVEVCENIVRELMEPVSRYVTGDKGSDKLVGCVGDFDRIQLADGSLDFVFDFYSLHHSNDLDRTLRELSRVLKRGGAIFCFDKARADGLSDADLDRLLDVEYSDAAKRNMGVPAGAHLTRRMNGEKEYRLKDWKAAFERAGLGAFRHYHIARTSSSRPLVRMAKTAISRLPAGLQARVTGLLKGEGNKNSLEQSNRIYSDLLDRFPKEVSFMCASKT